MRVYISGPITDTPDFKQVFGGAVLHLRTSGHEVWNPADLPEGHTYGWYMRECLKALPTCDAIYMLKNWEKSPGARCEHLCAVLCDMEVMYER